MISRRSLFSAALVAPVAIPMAVKVAMSQGAAGINISGFASVDGALLSPSMTIGTSLFDPRIDDFHAYAADPLD